MDHQYDRRHNDELSRKLANILDYFDVHKEDIIAGMTSGVKLRELVGAGVVFGSIMMGMMVFILDQHAEHPHKNALHKDEFRRFADQTNAREARIEAKLDRVIELRKQ